MKLFRKIKKTSTEVRNLGSDTQISPLLGSLRQNYDSACILPHLTVGEGGKPIRVNMTMLIETILYKLKTGYQLRQLPVNQAFIDDLFTWQVVY